MASSGSVDFSVSRDDIILEALELIGCIGQDQTPNAKDINTCSRSLNLLVKQWSGDTDFAPGLKVWSRKRATLFLAQGTHSYSLGPTGTHWTSSYVRTTLAANETANATAIDVNSITGINSGDYVGIELNDGTLHWTTVNGAPGGGVVTITTGIASAADAGRYLWTYTTKARRPLKILTANLKDVTGVDTPLSMMTTLQEYEGIGNKTADGEPTAIFYEPQLTNGVLYTDLEPVDVTKVISCVYLSPIEDFDAANDTPDYPQEWYLALAWGLAKQIWPKYWDAREWPATHQSNYAEAITIAKQTNPETMNTYYQPGLE